MNTHQPQPNVVHIVILCLITWAVITAGAIALHRAVNSPNLESLPVCRTEDSVNCVWTDPNTGDQYVTISSTLN